MDCPHPDEQWTLVTVASGDSPTQTLTCRACADLIIEAAEALPGSVFISIETTASGDFPTDDVAVIG